MIIDTHAHINFDAFREDADEVIKNTLAEKIWMILVGTDYKTSKRALDLANKYEKGVYAAIGLHPIHLFSTKNHGDDYDFVSRSEEFNYDLYDQLAKFEKTVAVGEIGLDYFHIDRGDDVNLVKKKQQEIFYEQLLLAANNKLPVIIHCRNAHDDTIKIINDFKKEYKHLLPKDKPWG